LSREEEEAKIVSHRHTTQIAVLFSILLIFMSLYALITSKIEVSLMFIAVIFTIGFFALMDEQNYLLHRIERVLKDKDGRA